MLVIICGSTLIFILSPPGLCCPIPPLCSTVVCPTIPPTWDLLSHPLSEYVLYNNISMSLPGLCYSTAVCLTIPQTGICIRDLSSSPAFVFCPSPSLSMNHTSHVFTTHYIHCATTRVGAANTRSDAHHNSLKI